MASQCHRASYAPHCRVLKTAADSNIMRRLAAGRNWTKPVLRAERVQYSDRLATTNNADSLVLEKELCDRASAL